MDSSAISYKLLKPKTMQSIAQTYNSCDRDPFMRLNNVVTILSQVFLDSVDEKDISHGATAKDIEVADSNTWWQLSRPFFTQDAYIIAEL